MLQKRINGYKGSTVACNELINLTKSDFLNKTCFGAIFSKTIVKLINRGKIETNWFPLQLVARGGIVSDCNIFEIAKPTFESSTFESFENPTIPSNQRMAVVA